MSKTSKWKLEKTKVKVVFRLQFHATHIPQSGWDKLFISLIPTDLGKATAKTTKANARNGTCKWADPIYETTRLLQDTKSKQYDEKLYKLVVAMGSSRASVLGEAVINLAEYSDAVKPSVVGLPLLGCNFGTTLHVTVQLLTSKTGFREFEQQRELRDKGIQSGDKHDGSSPGKAAYMHEIIDDPLDKVHTRVRYPSDASVEEYTESSGGSEGLYTEKHDTSINSKNDSLKDKESEDTNGMTRKNDHLDNQINTSRSIDPINERGANYLTDNDLVKSLDLAASSVFELKLEVSSLQIQAEELSTETEKFSGILESEISSSKKLAKEVSELKEECFHCKDDLECLKDVKSIKLVTGEENVNHLLQDIKLRFSSGIKVVEDRVKELQSKTYERDARYLHLDLDVLLHTIQDLKNGMEETLLFLNPTSTKRTDEISLHSDKNYVSDTGLEIEVCEPEIMLQHLTSQPVVSQVNDSSSDIDAMKKDMFALVKELDEAKVEREGLVRKMGQMECYYEALVQDLEETQKQLMGELKNIRNEHSSCLYELSATKVEMESMHRDTTHQILQLTEERCGLDALNNELERRAATSDAALRRARLNYSIAVDKLQKDLELLSSQVVSMFETNETLIKQAFSEPPKPLYFGSVDDDATRNSKDFDAVKLLRIPTQNASAKKQQGREIFLEDLKQTLCVQEKLYHKVEEELTDMHSVNLHLDIFSNALKESLRESCFALRKLREEAEELENQFRVSDESRNILVVRLQAAMDDVNNLREYSFKCNAHYNDVSMQNQILEARLKSILNENSLLLKEIEDREVAMAVQSRTYQTQYATCLVEKSELSDSLSQETRLSSTLNEELETLKTETFELRSSKENLEETINFIQKKLLILNPRDPSIRMDCRDAMSLLENKFHELMEENNKLENEKLLADISLNSVKSESLDLEKKLKSTINNIVNKLNTSDPIMDDFGVKLELVSNKLVQSSATGERHVQKHRELLDHLIIFETEMHNLLCEDGHLVNEFSSLNAVSTELETSKLTINGLIQEKHELVTKLRNLEVELEEERDIKRNFNTKIEDLTSQVIIEQNKFRDLSLQNFESESLCLKDLLLQRDVLIEKLRSESCSVSNLETQLTDALKYIVNVDIKDSFFTSLYQIRVKELEQKLICLDACFQKLQRRCSEAETRLNCCLVKESDYVTEISESGKLIESVRSELEHSLAQNAVLLDSNKKFVIELGEYKGFHMLEVKKWKKDLEFAEEEIIGLVLSNVQMEIVLLGLKYKTQELDSFRGLLEEIEKESLESRARCIELENSKDDLARANDDIIVEFNKQKEKTETLQVKISENEYQHTFKAQRLKNELASAEEEIVDLTVSKHVLEITMIELEKKVQERHVNTKLLEKSENELLTLRSQCTDLSPKKSTLQSENDVIKIELDECKRELEDLDVLIFKDIDLRSNEANKSNSRLEIAENEIFGLTFLSELLQSSLTDLQLKLQKQLDSSSLMENEELVSLRKNCAELSKCKVNAEEEITRTILSEEQSEIIILVLKEKLQELVKYPSLLKESEDQVMALRLRCTNLSRKLSEQTLKTEEYKNLSTHLKDLQEKSVIDSNAAREKRDAMQESLRIAFIKEQYESKLHELKQQVFMSKKHNEEMLLKLQDAVDEIETRKRSESLHLKRNEELALKILGLEDELQSVVSDNRERIRAHDRMKAEFECAVLSLECCKEEKELLEISLRELEVKMSALTNKISEDVHYLPNESTDVFMFNKEVESQSPDPILDNDISDIVIETQAIEEDTARTEINGFIEPQAIDGHLQHTNGTRLSCQFGSQDLKSSIMHLHDELERIKNENFVILEDETFGSELVQKDIMRLDKVNEELGSMIPLDAEVSSTENALESFLDLEVELAETLRSKYKSKSDIQRQQCDDETILKSFRDINNLIKEMLQLKGKHVTMEAELREMHDRYSQLSLQFAEVEGDRQKLKMTLKNVRASRKLMHLNRSSSAVNAEVSS